MKQNNRSKDLLIFSLLPCYQPKAWERSQVLEYLILQQAPSASHETAKHVSYTEVLQGVYVLQVLLKDLLSETFLS